MLQLDIEVPQINTSQMYQPSEEDKAYFLSRSGRFNYAKFMNTVREQMAVGEVYFPKKMVKLSHTYGNKDSRDVAEKKLSAAGNLSNAKWRRVRPDGSNGYGYEKIHP